jgi:hypothetical protein
MEKRSQSTRTKKFSCGPKKYSVRSQCDQIGRLFAYWAIIYFGWILKITEIAFILGRIFPRKKVMFIILRKEGLGYILGDFFTSQSGHPARGSSRDGAQKEELSP